MIYIVLGAPGVGKGTRAKILGDYLGIKTISTGSLIRESQEIFNKYKDIVAAGNLLPDEAIKEMMLARLIKDDMKDGFILDGYPRSINQAKDLEDILKTLNKKIKKAFLFEADEATIYDRALNRKVCVFCDKVYGWGKENPAPEVCEICGKPLTKRVDDNVETIKQRLDVYHTQTDPIIQYYIEQGLVEKIDALDVPEKVLESVNK